MPYQFLPSDPQETRLHLWPHRSLNQRGFVWFIGLTATLIGLPMLGVIGSPVVWALLPFLLAAIWGIWFALRKNGRDRDIVEDLTLTPASVTLTRHGPRGQRQDWQANPHWVRLTLHETGGPVPNYLTLRGSNREVELGAFLSEDERIALKADLSRKLAALR
jgi:uncharacterized membrane protein